MTISEPIDAAPKSHDQKYLFGKFVDFFCLGGGSLIVLALLAMLPPEPYKAQVLFAVWIIAAFVNHPHFIHSYQIFYDGFREKSAEGAPLRTRYLFAGVIVPVLLVAFFAVALVMADAAMLGKAVYLMFFLVGWHYVKQGYGILMVESVLKRAFFNDFEKQWLRYNALAVWLSSWLYFNHRLHSRELWGSEYFLLGIPLWIAQIAIVISIGTSLFVVWILIRKRTTGTVPVNGILAYFTACYVWLVLSSISPLAVLLVPAFHSLQYLAVVWRYQINKDQTIHADKQDMIFGIIETTAGCAAFVRFILVGFFVGIVAFYLLPFTLDASIAYREDIFGTVMFLFIINIFINIHHYFLDNVMWRKENRNIKEYLLS